jgi:hypothetical protein
MAGKGEKAERIVAFIDEHLCSLAAVRRAIPLVPHDGSLLVVQISPRVPPWIALSWSQGICLPDSREDVVANTFKEVASLLAPTGLSWDFSVGAAPAAGAAEPGATVTVRHRGGLWHTFFGAGRVERFARACHPSRSPLVLSCGHGGELSATRGMPSVFGA